MARTILNSTKLSRSSPAAVAASAIDQANGMQLVGRNLTKTLLIASSTAAGPLNMTIRAGISPPADGAGVGDLVIAIGAGAEVAVAASTERFMQKDGSMWLDWDAGFTGLIEAYEMPH